MMINHLLMRPLFMLNLMLWLLTFFTVALNYAFSIEITARTFGTVNSINNGFGTVQECQSSNENSGCNRDLENLLSGILNLTTQNQCIASRQEFNQSGIDIPNCPDPNGGFRGLDHSYPSGGIFGLYTGDNSAFLHGLVTEYLSDNPAGRFNLVLPRTRINSLQNDQSLISVINNSRVNIIPVETMPSVERWMQDSFEFGTLDGKPAIYQLEHHREVDMQLEERLACLIAKSCDVPYLIPPDMVDPLNTSENSLNSGGNLETLPGGTIYRGTIQTDGFSRWNLLPDDRIPFQTSAQAIQRQALEEAGNRVLDINVSFLRVGHVDEIINVVQTNRPAPCNFAVLLASPEKAFELMEAQARDSRDQSAPESSRGTGYLNNFRSLFINEAHAGAKALASSPANPLDRNCQDVSYHALAIEGQRQRISSQRVEQIYNFNCMDDQHITSFVDSEEYALLKMLNLEGFPPEIASISSVMERNRELLMAELTETTGCQEVPVVDVPVFFQGGLSYAPDLVNGVVHTNANNTSSIIMPRTYFRAFDEYIEQELSELGVGATFVHGMEYHNLHGQVHCGTNTARICR